MGRVTVRTRRSERQFPKAYRRSQPENTAALELVRETHRLPFKLQAQGSTSRMRRLPSQIRWKPKAANGSATVGANVYFLFPAFPPPPRDSVFVEICSQEKQDAEDSNLAALQSDRAGRDITSICRPKSLSRSHYVWIRRHLP
ncbi:hypothetical protein SCP_0101520 [Sparassis crispa]|uniref:Uncharacterized protein n=1 Tax=Sparassis crispa TaxID=139825 RepID=A0A401G549_9APHY|nr:hypothetical protein SCP_0101520 [Sparassis crispa]GBE77279.1 hypothetical protein SCP_0101520 [Sparassis crispa]